MRSAMMRVDHRHRQPRQQGDALAQGGLERQFAAHGALGDGRTFPFRPDEIGEFVDAFLADHGGIHVGEEQPLAPVAGELDDDVHRRARRGAAAPASARARGQRRRRGA